MASPVDHRQRWSELHGGYDPSASRLVGAWLSAVHVPARRLAAAGVPPAALTLLGGLLAWAAAVAVLLGRDAGWGFVWAGVLLVALSGIVDSLDGAVAVLEGRTSAAGHVLDPVVDRVAEVAYVVALWWAGAPPAVCVAGGVLALLLEYVRVRAAVAGMRGLGVLTDGERPTRVIVFFMLLLG
jgi:CDP-diacylglycerol--glycerol-3-phosphate 3-phosphatidyltransferase